MKNETNYSNDKNIKAIIELRNNRLYLLHYKGMVKLEIDITPVWHFMKEALEFQSTTFVDKDIKSNNLR